MKRRDGKFSHPDAESCCDGETACLDAKNHSKCKINVNEVNKLIEDANLRDGKPAIMPINEKGTLTDDAYKKCKEKDVIIALLKKNDGTEPTLDSSTSNFDKEY